MTSEKNESDFGAWLAKQGSRGGKIGDLAKQSLRDPTFPWPAGDPETIRRYLWRRGSWPARVALEDGVEEWGGRPVRDWEEEELFGEGCTPPADARSRIDAADHVELHVEAVPDEVHPRGWWHALLRRKV